MTRKQIDMLREARLWVGQIIVPTAMAIGTALTIPEVREAVAARAKSMKRSIEDKFRKEERP